VIFKSSDPISPATAVNVGAVRHHHFEEFREISQLTRICNVCCESTDGIIAIQRSGCPIYVVYIRNGVFGIDKTCFQNDITRIGILKATSHILCDKNSFSDHRFSDGVITYAGK
jgi:hypothetical protein